MRAGGVEARVAARAHVDHRRHVVLDQRLVDRKPVPIGQRRRVPVSAWDPGFRLTATNPYSLTQLLGQARLRIHARRLRQHRSQFAGNSFATRWISSLQIAAHVLLVSKPPMWCAMKLARGEKIVRSAPRSRISFSWFCSMLSRSSSPIRSSSAGRQGGVLESFDLAVAPVFERLGRGRVMAVAIDDHATSRSRTAEGTMTSPRMRSRAVRTSAARGFLRIGRIDPEFHRELTGRMLDGDRPRRPQAPARPSVTDPSRTQACRPSPPPARRSRRGRRAG